MNERKYIAAEDSRMDCDSAPFAVMPNCYVNGQNFRTATTDAGVTETAESIGSNVLISQALPSVVFLTLGSVEDTESDMLIKFNYNTTGTDHKIVCLFTNTNIEYNVVLSSQVEGGLNFDKNSPIHSAKIVNGILYWPEGTANQPRRVNIKAGINLNTPNTFPVNAYVAPLLISDIAWIRRQPALPLSFAKGTDAAFVNNFIEDEAFEFCYRYISREYETSTLSPLSLLANYNVKADTFNDITITFPLLEKITQDVLQVDLVARYLNSSTYFIINSWNKNISADAAAIIAHNAGTPLTYTFYNDFTGIALDDAYSVKPFDSVPIYAQTIEFARNRAHMANITAGLTTPTITSLAIQPSTQSSSGVTGQWVKIAYNSGSSFHYFLDLGTLGFFDVSPQPTPLPYPTTEDYVTDLTFVAAGPANFGVYVSSHYSNWVGGIQYPGFSASVTSAPTPSTLIGTRVFKSAASYRGAVTFYDFAGRKCGYITNSTILANIPDIDFDHLDYTVGINWSLSNANAANEIPLFAATYSIDLTMCLRTRDFLQLRNRNTAYATKDTDGNYVFTNTTYTTDRLGCAWDITSLGSNGMGYVWTADSGDVIKIYLNGGGEFQLKIVAQVGNFLVTELTNAGTLDFNTRFLFEIYTPYRPSLSEPYFEQAQIYQITNAGTDSRTYSVISGQFQGDVTILQRNDTFVDYLTENMSSNDKFFNIWNTNAGRPNFKDDLGQVVKTNTDAYSNVFIQGTRNDGICTFDALDTKDIPDECGSISKLQLTSKVQDQQGQIMLAICVDETASLYLGEVQLVGSSTNAFVAQADGVIGTINILKGSYGTINAESVIEYRGDVYWADANNRKWIQYSVNGLDVISDYKMTRFWNLWFLKFNSMSNSEIEAFGGRPFIFTAVDPYHKELLISIPKLSNTPPKGYLPDYPSEIYPFDPLDYQAKIMVYKLGVAGRLPHWAAPQTWYVENLRTLQNNLYTFKNGLTYKHNQVTSTNNFFGVQYKSRVAVVANQVPQVPKVYNNQSVESNITPSWIYMYNDYPVIQASDILDYEINPLEGVWYATIKRNKLVPTATGYTTDGLLTGEKMRNTAMLILYEFTVSSVFLELRFIQIGFEVSKGHMNQITK